MIPSPDEASLRAQHKLRMCWMPWLYFRAKPEIAVWAREWQREVHARVMSLERVQIDAAAFVAPDARLFAEPHREIVIGSGASVAAECVLHGPIRLASEVSLNPRVVLDAGGAGIEIGQGTRIARAFTCSRGTMARRRRRPFGISRCARAASRSGQTCGSARAWGSATASPLGTARSWGCTRW